MKSKERAPRKTEKRIKKQPDPADILWYVAKSLAAAMVEAQQQVFDNER